MDTTAGTGAATPVLAVGDLGMAVRRGRYPNNVHRLGAIIDSPYPFLWACGASAVAVRPAELGDGPACADCLPDQPRPPKPAPVALTAEPVDDVVQLLRRAASHYDQRAGACRDAIAILTADPPIVEPEPFVEFS